MTIEEFRGVAWQHWERLRSQIRTGTTMETAAHAQRQAAQQLKGLPHDFQIASSR